MATMYSSALQALAVVASAVVLQQYTQRRAARVSAAEKHAVPAKKTASGGAHDPSRHVLPVASIAAEDPQDDAPLYVVEIEYCTGCRWMLRAAWMAQELLTTFQADASSRLRSVVLTPNSRQGGVFQVYLYATDNSLEKELLWSRKAVGRFPESKELKQIVRDYINPDKGLGHSDKK